jgi:hypothetical protein
MIKKKKCFKSCVRIVHCVQNDEKPDATDATDDKNKPFFFFTIRFLC